MKVESLTAEGEPYATPEPTLHYLHEAAPEPGEVREIAPDGLLVELQGEHVPAGPLEFELQSARSRVKFVAQGDIVHSDRVAGRTRVRVKFTATRFVPV